MKYQPNWITKKRLRVVTIILVSFLILILVANFILSRFAEQRIRTELKDKPVKNYRVTFKKVHVNLLTMSVSFTNFEIEPFVAGNKAEINMKSWTRFRVQMVFPVLRFRYLNALSLLFGKEHHIRVGEIVARRGKLVAYYPKKYLNQQTIQRNQTDHLLQNLQITLPGINSINIHTSKIIDLSFLWIDPGRSDTLFQASGVNVSLKSLAFLQRDTARNKWGLSSDQLSFDLSIKHTMMKLFPYHLTLNRMTMDYSKGKLSVKQIKLLPEKNAQFLASESTFRKNIYMLTAGPVLIKIGELHKIFTTKVFYIPKVWLNNFFIKITHDASLPIDKSKYKLFPNQLIRKINSQIYIDSIIVRKGKLSFEETNRHKDQFVTLNLNRLSADIGPITSIKDSLKQPIQMKWHGLIQNKIPFDFLLVFPSAIRDTFDYYGTVGKGPISVFNPILVSRTGIRFDDGHLRSVTFKIHSNSHYASGDMTMLYHDLKGTFLKKDKMNDNKLLTWVVNKVLQSDNPLQGELVRTVPIYFKHISYQGFGFYVFRPILNGVLATVLNSVARSNQKNIKGIKKEQKRKPRGENEDSINKVGRKRH